MFNKQHTRTSGTVLGARWSPAQRPVIRDELISLCLTHGVLRQDGDYLVFNTDFDSLKTLVGGRSMAMSGPAHSFLTAWAATG